MTSESGAGQSRLRVGFAWSAALAFALSLAYFLASYFIRFGTTTSEGGGLAGPVIVDVSLFSAFALHHSVLARQRVKTALSRVIPPPLERATFVWIASLLFVVTCAYWQTVPGELYDHGGLATAPHVIAVTLGLWLTLRSASRLDVLELAGVRQASDQATDRSRPAGVDARILTVVSTGPYGIVRHPIYLGWLLLVFGPPHMTATRLTFALVSAVYLVIAIPLEERALATHFGAAYENYRKQVRWRVVPFVY